MNPNSPQSETPGTKTPTPVKQGWNPMWVFLALLMVGAWLNLLHRDPSKTISYSEFKGRLRAGEVTEALVSADEVRGRIDAKEPVEGVKDFFFRTERVEDPDLVKELEEKKVKYTGRHPSFFMELFWVWIFPLLLMWMLWSAFARRVGSAAQGVVGFGKSRAKMVADKDTGVKFGDVAGCDEAKYELQEVVDFLINSERYRSLGARIPKGVLLVGPPGTGKTLLARAVAGEAKVPFFSLSGSDFVEMFVGVGAARVRDLFEQALTHAPCIVFIDELDAIGRQRGFHPGMANDEREQTLNQLLVEMDGFQPNAGIIILAATNRPDVLDVALLRPGRFDRQVVLDAPDLDGREQILKIHSRGKPLGSNVDLHKIAQATPGFSGADLANAFNEAALLAARRNAKEISQLDLEEAVEKVVTGPERKSRRLGDDEKRRVAYHEVGHALVAAYSEHADPVHKVSIVPRGRAALGYTLQRPVADRFLISRAALLDHIKCFLGGRAAEEIIFGDVTTGAENDLERATILAQQMVCVYGMSESVGLVHVAKRENPFQPLGGMDGVNHRDFSEQTARRIDLEVRKILDDSYAAAKELLERRRDELEGVVAELLRRETLDAEGFMSLLKKGEEEEMKIHAH